jgi:hypothetical protein
MAGVNSDKKVTLIPAVMRFYYPAVVTYYEDDRSASLLKLA